MQEVFVRPAGNTVSVGNAIQTIGIINPTVALGDLIRKLAHTVDGSLQPRSQLGDELQVRSVAVNSLILVPVVREAYDFSHRSGHVGFLCQNRNLN